MQAFFNEPIFTAHRMPEIFFNPSYALVKVAPDVLGLFDVLLDFIHKLQVMSFVSLSQLIIDLKIRSWILI